MLQKQLQVELLKAAAAQAAGMVIDVVVHESIDSTNSWSSQQCESGSVPPFACFAEQQTCGRGRRGKRWLMPVSSNIAMSLTWPFAVSYLRLQLLPLAVAIAIAETLESLLLQQVEIKWPNDVYVQGKKIAGILIETQPLKVPPAALSDNKCLAVIIGIGLNYDMSAVRADNSLIDREFTDICSQLESQSIAIKTSRAEVAAGLLQAVVKTCQGFERDAKPYLEKFRAHYDYCRDKNVEIILDDGRTLSGIARGINDDAQLLVMIAGRQHLFNSAEVSLRAGSKQTAKAPAGNDDINS